MIVGGYTLDLYCDRELPIWYGLNGEPFIAGEQHRWRSEGSRAGSFYGETFAECKRAAQKSGWAFHRNRTVTCPDCARAGKLAIND